MGYGTRSDICHGRSSDMLMSWCGHVWIYSLLLYEDWHLWVISNWSHGGLLNKGRWNRDIFQVCGGGGHSRWELVYILNLGAWRSEV
jgi:hypothetical protein